MIIRVIKILHRALAAAFVAAALSPALLAQEEMPPLVDIKAVDRTIIVELRYASENNITGRALYSPETRALVRPEVAQRLAVAQAYLRIRQYGLKIWDAYRPKSAQVQLWQASQNNLYVADPDTINGSLHSRGLAVDATLVDARNQEVSMPTDFDDFTPAAMWRYQGADPHVRTHLALLQRAMRQGGFHGLKSEWWHFVAPDWKRYVPDPNQDFRAHRSSSKTNL